MKKNYQQLAFIALAAATICSLSSCYTGSYVAAPYVVDEARQRENFYYIPSAPNTPLNAQKNDVNFNAMRISDPKFSGADVQASFMPGKHVGIMGSFSFAGSKEPASDYVSYNRLELGAGYVTPVSQNLLFELYGGFGSGKIVNTHYTGGSRLTLTHFFLQPAIAVTDPLKVVQLGLVSKFSAVNFNVTDTSFATDREPFSTAQLTGLYDQPFHVMWEPGLVLRIGWKNFQFHTGYSFSADLTNPDLHRAEGNFSMGVRLRFNTHEQIFK